MSLTLYGYWRSSSAWRVRIALAFKDVEYEHVPVHLVEGGGEQHAEGYRARNPMRQVPLLEVRDAGETRRIAQSVAIIEYLEAVYPEPRLIPEDAYLAAKARQMAEIVNAGIQPLQNLRVLQEVSALGGDKTKWAAAWIARGFDALEAEMRPLAGRYAVGDRVTIADLFVIPQIYNARRNDVDLTPYPTLLRVERACAELPMFAMAHPDRQPDAP